MAISRTLALAINRIRSISAFEKMRLAATLHSPRDLLGLSLGDLECIIRRRTRIRTWEPRVWVKQAEHDEKSLTVGDFKCTFYFGRDYPPLLREIHDPPYLLFYRGTLPGQDAPALAVVGTRYPTGRGKKAAFGLGLDAGFAGISVVSGLARGIDSAAHEGNSAGGGKSVAVLGCGIDRIYPDSSTAVARRMLEAGGCVFSEHGTGILPLKYNFPERNRIISGIARSVVVVEAPEKSGALITAEFALEQGRDLYVHGGCLETGINGGCRRLKSEGAEAVYGGADILTSWGYVCENTASPSFEGTEEGRAKLKKELSGELITYAGEYYSK